MKKEDLFMAIGNVDDKKVEIAGNFMKGEMVMKNSYNLKVVWFAVACLVLTVMVFPITNMIKLNNQDLHSYIVANGGKTMIVEDGGTAISGDVEATGSDFLNSGALEPSIDVTPTKEALEAYQNLMNHFKVQYGNEKYPDWYGGAYIMNGNYLIVNILNSYNEEIAKNGDKSFYMQIQEWTKTTNVGFGGANYSLSTLNKLKDEIEKLPELKVIESYKCGVSAIKGKVQLVISEANENLLSILATLDPNDDMIVVEIGKIADTPMNIEEYYINNFEQ